MKFFGSTPLGKHNVTWKVKNYPIPLVCMQALPGDQVARLRLDAFSLQ